MRLEAMQWIDALLQCLSTPRNWQRLSHLKSGL